MRCNRELLMQVTSLAEQFIASINEMLNKTITADELKHLFVHVIC